MNFKLNQDKWDAVLRTVREDKSLTYPNRNSGAAYPHEFPILWHYVNAEDNLTEDQRISVLALYFDRTPKNIRSAALRFELPDFSDEPKDTLTSLLEIESMLDKYQIDFETKEQEHASQLANAIALRSRLKRKKPTQEDLLQYRKELGVDTVSEVMTLLSKVDVFFH